MMLLLVACRALLAAAGLVVLAAVLTRPLDDRLLVASILAVVALIVVGCVEMERGTRRAPGKP